MSHDKPVRPQDHLGPDVKLETTKLEEHPWATTMLKELGKTLKPENHNYLGSVAIHIYEGTALAFTGGMNAATVNQLSIDNCAEGIVGMGVSNAVIEIKKHYGHKHTTRDPNDKR